MKFHFCSACTWIYLAAWDKCPSCGIYTEFQEHDAATCPDCHNENKNFLKKCAKIHARFKTEIEEAENFYLENKTHDNYYNPEFQQKLNRINKLLH